MVVVGIGRESDKEAKDEIAGIKGNKIKNREKTSDPGL